MLQVIVQSTNALKQFWNLYSSRTLLEQFYNVKWHYLLNN